jgi:VIT1/CCC1 family predicted Fe2+/Mn2+ transporter
MVGLYRRLAVDAGARSSQSLLASHDTRFAFIAGLATSIGAAISMGFSEALSDTGELTGRGSPWSRGLISGSAGTFLGGILHSLPFLIADLPSRALFAIAVVAFELVMLAYFRYRFFQDTFVPRPGNRDLCGRPDRPR